jgi:capsule polysaccharide export protein KpsE/RkpR
MMSQLENTSTKNSSIESLARTDFLTNVARHWRRIALLGLCGAVALILFSFTRPQTFVATVTVLPPEHEGAGGMLAFLANSANALDLLKGGLSENPTLDLFKTIVESRSISEDVGHDPAIYAYFHRRDTSLEAMTNVLQGCVQSEAMRTGMMTVSVKLSAPGFASKITCDSARQMTAYLANKFVEALDRFNRDRLMTSAKNTRIFVEQEYKAKMVELDSAYGRLEQFQESHEAISLPEQLAATVSAAAKLTGQKQQLEMQRTVEAHELGPNSPQIQALAAEEDATQEELNKYDSGGAGEYVLALNSAPALSRELAGYLREVKVLEQVSAYLREELEQERVSEQRDLPSLQVLDAAQVPTERSSPSRTLFAVIGLLLGLVFGLGLTGFQMFASDVRARPDVHYRLLNILRAMRLNRTAAKN